MLVCVFIELERRGEMFERVLLSEVNWFEFVASVANTKHEKVHGIVMRVG